MHFALLAWPVTGQALPINALAIPDVRRHGRAARPDRQFARRLLALLTACVSLLLPSPVRAAGGHHAVDDAVLLEPGQCQVETWAEDGREHHLQHVGPACRLGSVEAGLNLDRYSLGGNGPVRLAGLQLKWATELMPGLSWGAVWGANWQNTAPRFTGQSLLLPLSWAPREDLALHLNLGRDFHPGLRDHTRYGVALEWQPTPQWQGLAEYWSDGLRQRQRLGLRYLLSDSLSLDLSRARARTAPRDSWWTLGVNWVFAHSR